MSCLKNVWTMPLGNEECRMKKHRSATEGKTNEECADADEVGEQQLTAIGQQLKKNNYLPWMICEPNEKEGQLLVDDE